MKNTNAEIPDVHYVLIGTKVLDSEPVHQGIAVFVYDHKVKAILELERHSRESLEVLVPAVRAWLTELVLLEHELDAAGRGADDDVPF